MNHQLGYPPVLFLPNLLFSRPGILESESHLYPVPQLEAAIRRLFALNGVSIMRQKQNPIEGSEYISLDTLLSSEDAISFMGKDIANYLRNLLTDQYGWNIRNQLSHGLLGTSSFNSVMADRVVHAFMLLGIFKLQETQNLEQDS